ncbi:MAG: ABC transporter permease [Pseudomonadota bacterium]|nr:ABC transporter permease [Pseudomonadota bacterium]
MRSDTTAEMLALALRNIFRNRVRTALTLAAVTCGVAAIIVSGGFVEDVFLQLREATIHSRLGHFQVYRKGYLELGRRDPSAYLISRPEDVLNALTTVPHVTEVMTRLMFSGLANNGRSDLPIIGEGVQPAKEARLGTATTYLAGRALSEDDQFGVTLGEGVANALKVQPDRFVTLTVSTREGALNAMEFKVIGIFRSFSKDYDDHALRIPQSAAAQLLQTSAVHSVIVALDETPRTDAAVAAARARLGSEYEVKPWHELADFYNKTVELYRRQFGALQLVILVMLVLSVASTVNMVVYERTGEFGTLMALGVKPRSILRLILLENSVLGLIGAVLGLCVGIAAALALTAIGIEMPPPPGSTAAYTARIVLVPSILGAAAAIGVAASIAAAILPGRRAARLIVVDALRHNI